MASSSIVPTDNSTAALEQVPVAGVVAGVLLGSGATIVACIFIAICIHCSGRRFRCRKRRNGCKSATVRMNKRKTFLHPFKMHWSRIETENPQVEHKYLLYENVRMPESLKSVVVPPATPPGQFQDEGKHPDMPLLALDDSVSSAQSTTESGQYSNVLEAEQLQQTTYINVPNANRVADVSSSESALYDVVKSNRSLERNDGRPSAARGREGQRPSQPQRYLTPLSAATDHVLTELKTVQVEIHQQQQQQQCQPQHQPEQESEELYIISELEPTSKVPHHHHQQQQQHKQKQQQQQKQQQRHQNQHEPSHQRRGKADAMEKEPIYINLPLGHSARDGKLSPQPIALPPDSTSTAGQGSLYI